MNHLTGAVIVGYLHDLVTVLACRQTSSKVGISSPRIAAMRPGEISPACFINFPRMCTSLNRRKTQGAACDQALSSPIE